jgi:hypothetical protein
MLVQRPSVWVQPGREGGSDVESLHHTAAPTTEVKYAGTRDEVHSYQVSVDVGGRLPVGTHLSVPPAAFLLLIE